MKQYVSIEIQKYEDSARLNICPDIVPPYFTLLSHWMIQKMPKGDTPLRSRLHVSGNMRMDRKRKENYQQTDPLNALTSNLTWNVCHSILNIFLHIYPWKWSASYNCLWLSSAGKKIMGEISRFSQQQPLPECRTIDFPFDWKLRSIFLDYN